MSAHFWQISRITWARATALVAILSVAVGFVPWLRAATPASGAINTPADTTPGVKQSINYSGGPISTSLVGDIIVANTASFTCKRVNPPTACDWFDLNVNVPSSFYSASQIGLLQVHVTWQMATGVGDPSLSDLDLYIIKCAPNADGTEDCTTVGNVAQSTSSNQPPPAGNGRAEETVALFDPAPGHYRILVVGSIVTAPVNYSADLTYSLVLPPTPPPPTAAIFQNFIPDDASLGTDAGEPSIGVNRRSGNAMYQAGLETLRVSFDDAVFPATSHWEDVGAIITSTTSLDPILWTDPHTNRTFVSQLAGGCSLMAFTDDDGVNWFQNPVGCAIGAAADHQTVGGGPFASPVFSTDPLGYPDNAVYCAQAVVSAQCGQSADGGRTWLLATPVYTLLDCGGLHGHIRVGPNGEWYLPNSSCNGGQALAISKDNGISWKISPIPGSSTHADQGDSDPWVDVAQDGTVYFAYADGDGHAKVVVSHNQGDTWSQPFDAGASQGVVNTEFAAVVAGDPSRAAFAFLGTNTAGDTQSSTFAGEWFLYVAFTYDGGNTWTTYNATPNDPVQRGCIWNGGGGNPCRNLLDFNGIAMDAVGRVLVGYADGCLGDCIRGVSYSKDSLATIARQADGFGLLGAYDGQVFKTVPGAPVLSGMAGNAVNHLSWTDGSSGNSPITAHYVYRGTASGAETLLATLSGAATAYDDSAVTNGMTYFYQVSASNAVGPSPRSNEVELTPRFMAAPSAPRNLKATGKKAGILLTWSPPKDSGTAPVTSYRIYRSTITGLESLLTTVGNTTHFIDGGVVGGTTYYYQVTAVNSVGEGARSNEDSASPK